MSSIYLGNIATNQILTSNSSSDILAAGATYTGTAVDVSAYASVVLSLKTDQTANLFCDFSVDGINWDSVLTFSVTASVNEVHRITVTRQYFRCRVTNTSGSSQTYMRLQCLLGSQQQLTSSLSSTVQTDADALVTRSVLMGQTDNGTYINVPVTAQGHLEAEIHGPLLPFGSIHAEHLLPVFQTDAVYGINTDQVLATTSLSGIATASDSLFSCSTGTTIYASGTIQSRKRLRYRPGQGIVAKFTGLFTSPVASSYQLIGVGHAEDGIYIGYSGTTFGILYSNRGVREIQTLTITVASSHTENVTITLAGVETTVAVTNSGNIQRTVYEISRGTYPGWTTSLSGATIVFVANSAGNKTGAFTLSGTSATGTFAETLAGVASTDTFIAQSAWNGDVLDGTGYSGFVADWTKGNVFEIGIQYLGFGCITVAMETTSGINNYTRTVLHSLRLPNTLVTTSFRNPSFPFTMTAVSAGSTTNLSIKCGSFVGFIEGQKVLHGNRFSYFNQLTSVGSANYTVLFTILNSRYYGGIANQSVINIISLNAAIKHTSPVIIYIVLNGTLVGNPNFTQYASNSCSWVDTAATTLTVTSNNQILWSGHLGDTGEIDHHFAANSLEEFTLQPGDMISVVAKSSTGNASYVTASINTREDQ